jgi:four helix bundle protein
MKSSAPKNPKYDLEERLLDFSARIIRFSQRLPRNREGNHVARQVLRSGTSPLANHGEAQAAESVNDFLHKMRTCLKELRETHRWIRLVERVPMVKSPERLAPLKQENDELIRIFVSSINTAERRKDKK